MERNAFTLAEMLAVLVILGMILLIAYPIITDSLETYRKDLYDSQVKNIISSSESYVTDHIDEFACSEIGTDTSITLKDLQLDGYIDENIKNPQTSEIFGDSSTIIVTCKINNNNYNYTYEFIEG